MPQPMKNVMQFAEAKAISQFIDLLMIYLRPIMSLN